MKKYLKKLAIYVLPVLIGVAVRLVYATCKIRVHGAENRNNTIGSGKAVIGSFWHYSLLGMFYHCRKDNAVIMVSSSADGEYISRMLEHFGFKTVRGSRNKKGVQALKDLVKAARNGENTALVTDGSQGPERVAQPGAILIASMSGTPIVPMAWAASRYGTIRSWDRTAFPKPFSTVDLVYGEPFGVPPGVKGDAVETYRLELEQRLNALYEEMWALHGKKVH
ncbi:lysophospholipid acyltransferase family protein [Desulfosediminicola ganghwensis]|uniref:lysophospholipid acyltransferase family protein n=1 Tax=Desulfosediminicola ganghwensis TaxID=2569540 RepID=UPI0010AB9030|nr:lysophospholipid acyltransferase family protein [Desulfosediminicola ganghwensis]